MTDCRLARLHQECDIADAKLGRDAQRMDNPGPRRVGEETKHPHYFLGSRLVYHPSQERADVLRVDALLFKTLGRYGRNI